MVVCLLIFLSHFSFTSLQLRYPIPSAEGVCFTFVFSQLFYDSCSLVFSFLFLKPNLFPSLYALCSVTLPTFFCVRQVLMSEWTQQGIYLILLLSALLLPQVSMIVTITFFCNYMQSLSFCPLSVLRVLFINRKLWDIIFEAILSQPVRTLPEYSG